MGGLGAARRVASGAVLAAMVLGFWASGAVAAGTEGAPLRTNVCTLLTDAEVVAYANSIGGSLKAVPPIRKAPDPRDLFPGEDPTRHHVCTWTFDQASDDGSSLANNGTVSVSERRLRSDRVNSSCHIFSSRAAVRKFAGIGDRAEAASSVGCVLVDDVLLDVSFGGATENPVDAGVMAATLRKLAQVDEPPSPASATDHTNPGDVGPLVSIPGEPAPNVGATANVSSAPTLTAHQAASRAAIATGRRSSVPASLATPSEAFTNAKRVAQNALLAAALVLLLVFPSQLFNSTFDKHHERIEVAWRRRFGRGPRAERAVDAPARAWKFAAVAAVGAILSLFLNPHLKLNVASSAQFVGVLVTIFFGTAVGALVQRQYRRTRNRPVGAKLMAVPSGLAIALVCVIVSRAVHFQPGYLYGLVGGVAFTVALSQREAGQAEFTGFFAGLAVALAAWFVFAPVSSAANHLHPPFFVLVADSFLAAVFIGGIEGALFALVPVRFLPGHKVAQWSWPAWIVMAGVTAFLFVNVLLRPENGYLGQSSTASAVVTYGLFAVFGVASIAFWGWFRTHPDPVSPVEPEVAVSA